MVSTACSVQGAAPGAAKAKAKAARTPTARLGSLGVVLAGAAHSVVQAAGVGAKSSSGVLRAVAGESSLFGASARDLMLMGITQRAVDRAVAKGWIRSESSGSSATYRLTDAGHAELARSST